jgi:hypothetical protein
MNNVSHFEITAWHVNEMNSHTQTMLCQKVEVNIVRGYENE